MKINKHHNYLIYYSLCNFMTDFIEEKWEKESTNVRKVKLLTKQLKSELEKSIDHIFRNTNSPEIDMDSVLQQFVNSSQVMEFLFRVGLIMDEMDNSKKDELNTRMNELLLEYDVDLKTAIIPL